MAMDNDIKDLAERRVDYLRRKYRDISLDYIVQESPLGKWAIILYTEYNFNPMGFDIIESRTSWKRPEAIKEYNELVDEGYCVVVYVPKEVKSEVEETIKAKNGRENIRIFSMDKLLPMIKA
jgi:hypothetical protein